LHDAVLLGALYSEFPVMTNAIPPITLPTRNAVRSQLGGERNSAASHQLQHSIMHTRLRAARRLFLPMIPYDPS
jgi:hypothetical protein